MYRTLAAGLAALLALTACSVNEAAAPSSPAPAGAKEVTFLLFESPNLNAAYWDAQIKRATDAVPGITVKKVVAPAAGSRDEFAKQLIASGQFPDVHIGLQDILGFAPNLYAWTPEDLKDFECATCGATGGKVVQLPTNTQTHSNVYYNKGLFAKAGITAPPTTYAGLLDAAAKLKAKDITPFVTGGGPDAFASTLAWTGVLTTDVYAKNPGWMRQRREGKVKFSDPGFKAATQKFADLAAKGYIDKKDLSRDYGATQTAFLEGKGAMYPMGSWFASPGAGDNPENKIEIGRFNWPGETGSAQLAGFTGGGLTVSAAAKDLESAKRFALAFQLDKANLDASVKADALFPAIKGYAPPSMGPVFTESYKAWSDAKTAGAIVPSFGWEAGDDAMLPGMKEKWWSSAQDLVSGKKNVDDVLSYLDDEWDKSS
ncbi:ABC transporter substrate-binding protein [Nonomuraea sp. NPDC050540]|uniref:ABC transporter substrate-binding protein n=1 Tax=Nonomuraea sp. NPDC050540 TaxID=3364367 RepID=UPI00379E0392